MSVGLELICGELTGEFLLAEHWAKLGCITLQLCDGMSVGLELICGELTGKFLLAEQLRDGMSVGLELICGELTGEFLLAEHWAKLGSWLSTFCSTNSSLGFSMPLKNF